MASLNDVFRLVITGTYLAQQISNVFHYRMTSVGSEPNPAQVLTDEFIPTVGAAIGAVTSTGMVWDSCSARNLNSLTEFWDELSVSAMAGTVVGPAMPSFVTFNYHWPVPTKAIRGGRKAIGGVPEDSTIGNEPTSAALVDLSALAIAMDQNLVSGGGTVFAPVVARIPTPEPSVYVPVNFIPTTIQLKSIGTQNTRKKGRGA